MDYMIGWKRFDAVLKRMAYPWASESTDMLLDHAKIALKKYYWRDDSIRRLIKHYWDNLGDDAYVRKLMKPFFDVADYVLKAFNANLEKDKECLYAGTIFLNSILKGTGRQFTLDVREANILSDVGKRLAEYIWEALEKSKGEPHVYEHTVHALLDSLFEEQQ